MGMTWTKIEDGRPMPGRSIVFACRNLPHEPNLEIGSLEERDGNVYWWGQEYWVRESEVIAWFYVPELLA